MRKILYVLIAFPLFSFAQLEKSLDSEMDSITTQEDARTFIKTNKNIKGKILIFNKEKHKTTLASELFALSKGGKKSYKNEISTTIYKIINKSEVPHYRASIIVLDSKKRTPSEINTLRTAIVNAYKSGNRKFEDLAKVYSSGRSSKTGGDLGWLKTGEQSEAFETALSTHAKDDIFLFDAPEGNKKYVILKTEDWTHIEEITVLKVTEPIR